VIGLIQRNAWFFTLLIGSVWVFHGLFSKILGGIPRHQAIVGRVLGNEHAASATLTVGIGEVALGLWVFSRIWRRGSALVQTLALVAMNTLEILLAKDLLVSALGMVTLNLLFLSVVWCWAWPRPAFRA